MHLPAAHVHRSYRRRERRKHRFLVKLRDLIREDESRIKPQITLPYVSFLNKPFDDLAEAELAEQIEMFALTKLLQSNMQQAEHVERRAA
jgi:hypothetical protein